LLFILVAPAGAGKNTLMNVAKANIEGVYQLPTATTRAIREGEVEGREHLYLSHDDFRRMIANSELLEWQEVHGQFYGIPRRTVENAIADGIDLIADIEYRGAQAVSSVFPDNVVQVFIQPPSITSLIARMRARGDSEAEISKRLMRVPEELAYAPACKYLILNDDMTGAAEELQAIIRAERSRQAADMFRAADKPNPVTISYAGVGIVIDGDEVLTRRSAPHFPTAITEPGEQPHEAALRAIETELHLPVTLDRLIVGGPAKGAFLPPVKLDSAPVDSGEQVVMQYVYRVDQHFDPPAGWSWTPKDRAELPSSILETLAAREPQ
jgi:guanylate kinase